MITSIIYFMLLLIAVMLGCLTLCVMRVTFERTRWWLIYFRKGNPPFVSVTALGMVLLVDCGYIIFGVSTLQKISGVCP